MFGGAMSPLQIGGALVLMLGLSHVSKYYVEDRFRHKKESYHLGRRTLGLSNPVFGRVHSGGRDTYFAGYETRN